MEMCVECFIFSSQTVKSMFVSDWKHIFFVFVSVSVCISALTCVCVVCVCSTGQISTCSGTHPTFPAWPTSDSPTVRSGGPTSCCTTGAQPRHTRPRTWTVCWSCFMTAHVHICLSAVTVVPVVIITPAEEGRRSPRWPTGWCVWRKNSIFSYFNAQSYQ